MKALKELKDYLANSETVKAFNKIEAIIEENEMYKNAYNDLLNKQKRMVQSEHTNRKTYAQDKASYEAARKNLEDHPVIHQYLILQEEINEELQAITSLIEVALKKPFNMD
jgi:cell fate (sporulation/competence/biofilm development) regulator YmcA (YheA/YmcA/DUF963 family)